MTRAQHRFVMQDIDTVLAQQDRSSARGLYSVATKILLQVARSNQERFSEDFTIQLTDAEWAALTSQIATLKPGRGQHRKYLPYSHQLDTNRAPLPPLGTTLGNDPRRHVIGCERCGRTFSARHNAHTFHVGD